MDIAEGARCPRSRSLLETGKVLGVESSVVLMGKGRTRLVRHLRFEFSGPVSGCGRSSLVELATHLFHGKGGILEGRAEMCRLLHEVVHHLGV